jgi:hypothetical protein
VQHAIKDQFLVSLVEHAPLAPWITKAADDDIGWRKVFLFGVAIGGGDDVQPGSLSCQDTIARILDHQALVRRKSGPLQGQLVDFGVGLFLADNIACQDKGQRDIAQHAVGHGLGGFFVGGGAHSKRQPGGLAFLHETMDPRPQRQGAAFDQLDEFGGLVLVHASD